MTRVARQSMTREFANQNLDTEQFITNQDGTLTVMDVELGGLFHRCIEAIQADPTVPAAQLVLSVAWQDTTSLGFDRSRTKVIPSAELAPQNIVLNPDGTFTLSARNLSDVISGWILEAVGRQEVEKVSFGASMEWNRG